MAYSMLTQTIPSYLYQEYSSDDDLQAFVGAYNSLAQEYVNWFNQIGLPVYTGNLIAGALLDWVAEGLYGQVRPALQSGSYRQIGPLNTFCFNQNGYNQRRQIGNITSYVVNDDVFKRILTWNLYKGDGKVFDISWLKRRIMRFLIGVSGTAPNIDQTYGISVTFGVGNQVNIIIGYSPKAARIGALYNGFAFNVGAYNESISTLGSVGGIGEFEIGASGIGVGTPNTQQTFALATTLKTAIDAGVVQLPFQYTYAVET